jgi:hypothetical protein
MNRTIPAPPPVQAPTTSSGTLGARRRVATRTSTFVGLIAGAALLTGCALPSVANMSPSMRKPASTQPSKTPSPAATPSSSPAATTATADQGDLVHGSLTRKLAAGERNLVVDYWTDADPATLSATTPTVLKVSAHMEDADVLHAVKVSRFLATLDDGTTTTTLSDDRGEFILTPPYSYGTALTLHPGNTAAKSVTLSVQFDLLIETVPGSGAFFRQTVLDNVRIAFPAEGTAS